MNQTIRLFLINLTTGIIVGAVLVFSFAVLIPALVERSVYKALDTYYKTNYPIIYEENNCENQDGSKVTNDEANLKENCNEEEISL